MKILILGASGQIGHHLHNYLQKELPDAEIIGAYRSLRLSANGHEESLQSIHFDPFEENWEKLGKVNILINAIGQIRESKDSSFEKVHIELVQRFLTHKKALGDPLFIQISALGAGEHQDLRFLESKSQADQLLLAQHENCFILRPSVVCSPEAMLAQRMKTLLQMAKASMGRLIVPRGFLSSRVQPILIADLCEAIRQLCLGKKTAEKILSLVGPRPVSFREILKLGAKAQEIKLKFIVIPRPVIEPSVRFFVAPMMPGILTYEQFQLLFLDNVASDATTTEILGRKPASSLPFWEGELGS